MTKHEDPDPLIQELIEVRAALIVACAERNRTQKFYFNKKEEWEEHVRDLEFQIQRLQENMIKKGP